MAAGLPSIPLSLRPSSMEVRVPKADAHGGAYEPTVVIQDVRWDQSGTLGANDYRLQDLTKGLVFIDATSPGAFDIPLGSLVEVDDGVTMEVQQTHTYRTWDGSIHHWEVELG